MDKQRLERWWSVEDPGVGPIPWREEKRKKNSSSLLNHRRQRGCSLAKKEKNNPLGSKRAALQQFWVSCLFFQVCLTDQVVSVQTPSGPAVLHKPGSFDGNPAVTAYSISCLSGPTISCFSACQTHHQPAFWYFGQLILFSFVMRATNTILFLTTVLCRLSLFSQIKVG